jgi:3-deoxy-D-manno-octulosonate 8-phosphate phosphatase (KDO 8-P phosphatase)
MNALERARRVEMLLMDVDGTLTEGTLLVMPDGEEVKAYHVWDGLGILLAQMAGLKVGIITGKTSRALEKRASRLRIAEVYQGVLDKKKTLDMICAKHGIAPDHIAYIGDDIGDIGIMKSVGLAGAVADAHPEVIESCHLICRTRGGRGAVREFIEYILKAQDKWDAVKTRIQEIKSFTV